MRSFVLSVNDVFVDGMHGVKQITQKKPNKWRLLIGLLNLLVLLGLELDNSLLPKCGISLVVVCHGYVKWHCANSYG